MSQYAASSAHKEVVLEAHVVTQLVGEQGYVERAPEEFERDLALDKELVLRFVRETQPDDLKKLEAQYAGSAEAEFFKQLEKALKDRGTLDVLRSGLKLIPNIRLSVCFFRPASNLNPALTKLYEANILSVMRQVRYSRKNENALDVVLCPASAPVGHFDVIAEGRISGSS